MMKKNTILLFTLFFIANNICAKDIVISNPVYEFTTTGITNVTRIELNKQETRLHIHSTFIPHWWVKFSQKNFIQDCETGEKFYATGIENGEFDKEIFMPASGDSTFVLIFPPLNKSVKKINLGKDDLTFTFGISLNPKEKRVPTQQVPQHIWDWMNEELEKADRKEIGFESPEEFFSRKPARLIGYIKGYDTRSGLSTGIIYAKNNITNEDLPTVLEIHPDGRFEALLPMSHPIMELINFHGTGVPFYIEPGQTLSILLDWEDFLKADRFRNRQYIFEDIQYTGPAAKINEEIFLVQSKLKELPYREMYENSSKMSPQEYKEYINSIFLEERMDNMSKLFEEEGISAYTQAILMSKSKIDYAELLLDFDMKNLFKKYRGETMDVLPADYFDFLQDTPINDYYALISNNYDVFINRFEHCSPFSDKYSVYNQEFASKELTVNEMERIQWNIQDSIYTHSLKLQPSLTYDMCKIRTLEFLFKESNRMTKEESREYLNWLEKNISSPFLISEAERIYDMSFPEDENKGYELPENDKGSEIFRKIIEPFKGKYVFVDFWGTFCAPCISGIEEMKDVRESYKNSDDAVFLFITSERESPLDKYNQFVEEQELTYTHRLSSDEYLYLRQLFKFNGIPRYILVGRDGRILNDKFPMHNFKYEVERLMNKEQSQ